MRMDPMSILETELSGLIRDRERLIEEYEEIKKLIEKYQKVINLLNEPEIEEE